MERSQLRLFRPLICSQCIDQSKTTHTYIIRKWKWNGVTLELTLRLDRGWAEDVKGAGSKWHSKGS